MGETSGTTGTSGTPSAQAASAVSAVPAATDLHAVSAVSASQPRRPEGVAATAGEAAAAALAAATAASPRAAANGDGYQYIISGDPVAAETADSSSASSETAALTSGMLADCHVYAAEVEARYRTSGECVGALRSDECRGMTISIR